jgi:hypothetical protein
MTTVSTGLNRANPSASFTRPADTTAYADGDLVANNTTAGSVAAMSFEFLNRNQRTCCIRGARIHKSGTGVTGSTFRVHLFSASPGVANGDNGAFVPSVVSGWLGRIEVVVDEAGTAGAVGRAVATDGIHIALSGPQTNVTLYGLLEAKGAYTPASGEVFTVTLEAEVD